MYELTDLIAGLRQRESFDSIADILAVARRHLGMDVAFISEFVGDQRIFRYVDPPDNLINLRLGGTMPLDEGFCRLIVDGALPELMADSAEYPLACASRDADAFPIGAHVGVPLRLVDERIYGTLCCFSGHPNRTLTPRDLRVMHALADLAAHQIDRARAAQRGRDQVVNRLEVAIGGEGLSVVYQPIYLLTEDRVVGIECLSRFETPPVRGPDMWFADAAKVGLLEDLELAALSAAFAGLRHLPDDVYLAVNVSPSTVLGQGFAALIDNMPAHRLVIEITEHADVADYGRLAERLAPLRARKLRLAVDDAGAGYASLQHILNLKPDIIKLDMSLTRGVDSDPVRRALAAALVRFAAEIGCQLVAEGIETDAELATLRDFGVTMAQGFRLCHPLPLADILRLIGPREAAPLL